MTTLTIEQEENLTQLLGETDDFAQALHAALTAVGDTFGLYEVMSQSGPVTSAQLAERTGVPEEYIRHWLEAQAAGEYLDYVPTVGGYCLWCSWPPNSQRV